MNVDAVYVITLKGEKERQSRIRKWYPKRAHIEFFVVERMKNPERGCYSSHQKVLRMAKERGQKRVLVLEDDAYPLYQWDTLVRKTNKALSFLMDNDSEWKHLMLGYLPFRTKKIKNNKNLVEILCAADAHAYIINIPNVKSIPWNGIPIDDFLFCNRTNQFKNLTGNFFKLEKTHNYGIHPMLITQKTEKSSIDPTHLWQKGFIDFFGNEEKLTEASTQVNTLNTLIFCFLILFLLLILVFFNCFCSKQKNYYYFVNYLLLFLLLFFTVFFLCTSINFNPNK